MCSQRAYTRVGWYRCLTQVHTHTGWKYHWEERVAAKTIELVQSLRCFPIQGSVYSLLALFEDQVLKLLWGSSVVLSCLGLGPCFLALRGPSTEDSSFCADTFLFETWSTLSPLEDQVPNFSHRGKTQFWSNFLICCQV